MAADSKPLEGPGRIARILPFGCLMLAGFAAVPLPPGLVATPGLLEAGALMCLLVATTILAPWQSLARWIHAVPPLTCLGVVILLRQAEGGGSSGTDVLVLVPILWFALYGSRTEMAITVAAVSLTFVGPILIIGAPEYDTTEWERAALWTAAAVIMGTAVQRLVRTVLAQADDLESLALTDSLTGLPNYRAWQDGLEREMSRAVRHDEPLCVAMIDLDGLKMINDTGGHQAGSRTISEAGAAWASRLRTTDWIARFGGDEFGVLLPNTPLEVGVTVCERLREATVAWAPCSVGIAAWDGAESGEDLFRRADRALYAAKDAGRNRTVRAPAASPDVVRA